jgi:hypothetical protein
MQAIGTFRAKGTRPVMKYPFISVFAALGIAAGSLALLAAPASADNGPPQVGCTTGSSCMIELNYSITYTGSSGGNNGIVVPPPPCIGVPFGDAHTGSDAIISLYNNTAPVAQPSSASPNPTAGGASPTPTGTSTSPAASPSVTPPASASPAASVTATASASLAALIRPALSGQQQQILNQAEQLAGSNPIAQGEWYQVYGDPYASAAAQQKCTTLPPYIWVPQGGTLPRLGGLNIPPETLAKLAYSQLTTAQLGTVTLNPSGQSDTNLPTFLDVTLQPPRLGVLTVTAKGVPYVWATATTPDGESATVWAKVTAMTIAPGTANATTFSDTRCTTAHLSADGHAYILGSRYPEAAMAKVGVGQQIDCGVTYNAPGTYGLTATVTWHPCWARGLATPGGPPANCKNVPGATDMTTTTPVDQVTVREIQSVNNG